jgi:hypothetical protein
VEAVARKQLHKHLAPIILLAAALLIGSLATFSSYAFPSASQTAARAFLTNLVSIKATSNGLARISVARLQAPPQSSSGQPLEGMANNLGQVTQLESNIHN